MQSVKSGVLGVTCGMRNVKCGMGSGEGEV